MNATENNKLIAEFMAGEKDKQVYVKHLNAWYDNSMGYKYNTDWNWLMEVVEKIEEMADWSLELLTTDKKEYQMLIHLSNTNIIGENKIEVVYNACVVFIKWYNEQNK